MNMFYQKRLFNIILLFLFLQDERDWLWKKIFENIMHQLRVRKSFHGIWSAPSLKIFIKLIRKSKIKILIDH